MICKVESVQAEGQAWQFVGSLTVSHTRTPSLARLVV